MSERPLAEVTMPDFAARAHSVDGVLRVELSGNADHGVLPELEAFVPRVHAEARATSVSEVVIDMTGLEFMNSSCFRTFVNWVGWIRSLEREHQYLLRFVATPHRHWQRPSLQALSCFAVNIVRIDNVA
jgi:anti-anti-sigma factor